MESVVYLLKICYHFLLIFILYCFAMRKSKRMVVYRRQIEFVPTDKHFLPFGTVFLFCMLEGLYSFLCGPLKTYLADRRVYAYFFLQNYFIQENSPLLYQIEIHLRQLTDNPDILFFVIAVIYMLVTCIAYNQSDDADPYVFLLVGASQYLLYGCYQLKQALAVAFIALSTAFFLKKKRVLFILFLCMGILSHESAYIAIPLFIVLMGSKKRWIQISEYVMLIIFMVFFRQISSILISIGSGIIPGLSKQVAVYLSDNGDQAELGIARALKGIPFYIITFYGFFLRKKGRAENAKYDKYLLISAVVSFSSLFAIYMPWMFRFGELFYIPDFLFAAYLRKISDGRAKKQYSFLLVLSFLTFTLYKLIISYWNYGGIV